MYPANTRNAQMRKQQHTGTTTTMMMIVVNRLATPFTAMEISIVGNAEGTAVGEKVGGSIIVTADTVTDTADACSVLVLPKAIDALRRDDANWELATADLRLLDAVVYSADAEVN